MTSFDRPDCLSCAATMVVEPTGPQEAHALSDFQRAVALGEDGGEVGEVFVAVVSGDLANTPFVSPLGDSPFDLVGARSAGESLSPFALVARISDKLLDQDHA